MTNKKSKDNYIMQDKETGNYLLVTGLDYGYMIDLFDKNKKFIEHDLIQGYQDKNGNNKECETPLEAGNVNINAYKKELLWGTKGSVTFYDDETFNELTKISKKAAKETEYYTNGEYNYFVKSTAEFEQFEDIDRIKNLSANTAIEIYKNMRKKGIKCGIGINIPNDLVFNDPNANGPIILEKVPFDKTGKNTMNILGEHFVNQIKENTDKEKRCLSAFETLYNTAKNHGLDIEDAPYIKAKKEELFNEKKVDVYKDWYNLKLNSKTENKTDTLIKIDSAIWNKLGISSSDDITKNTAKTTKYIIELKKHIDFPLQLEKKVYDELENSNYHLLNRTLSLMNAYEKSIPGLKEEELNFIKKNPDTFNLQSAKNESLFSENYNNQPKKEIKLEKKATYTPKTKEEKKAKNDEYEKQVAEFFIEAIKTNSAPWQKPWSPDYNAYDYNPVTRGKTEFGGIYKGLNSMYLDLVRHLKLHSDDPRWMTFAQVRNLNTKDTKKEDYVHVKAGEKGTAITFFSPVYYGKNGERLDPQDPDFLQDNVEKVISVKKMFYVFNAKQIVKNVYDENGNQKLDENGKPMYKPGLEPIQTNEKKFEPIKQPEEIVKNAGAEVVNDQVNECFYRPSDDKIHMVRAERFSDPKNYYHTLLHELTHWSGNERRLNREEAKHYGESIEWRAKEELVAEIGSYLLCRDMRLDYKPTENNVAYVKSWCQALKDTPSSIFEASKKAKQAADYIQSFSNENKNKNENKNENKNDNDINIKKIKGKKR